MKIFASFYACMVVSFWIWLMFENRRTEPEGRIPPFGVFVLGLLWPLFLLSAFLTKLFL